MRTLIAFPKQLDSGGEFVLPEHVVPFPRGFAFGLDGTLFLVSGVGPDGVGDEAKDGRLVRVMSPSRGYSSASQEGYASGLRGFSTALPRIQWLLSTLKLPNAWARSLSFRICMARR
jgi:hypothetical protein